MTINTENEAIVRRSAVTSAAAIVLMLMTFATPGWGVSLSATGPAQPLPAATSPGDAQPANDHIEYTRLAGSASLVPLVASDSQAAPISTVDSPSSGAAQAGKPVDDVDFLKRATESGRAEVQAAREALPQLKRAELKRIAEMLASDHSNANTKLQELAQSKGWPIPGPAAPTPPPAGTASSDFDAKWTAEMIAGHERSVALYRAQTQSGEDKELRKFARDTLPTIEHHLSELKGLQK